MRQHPNSGAGRMKYDMSDDDTLLEMKDANKVYSLNGHYLEDLYRTAIRQSKTAVIVVKFANGIVVEGVVRKDNTWPS